MINVQLATKSKDNRYIEQHRHRQISAHNNTNAGMEPVGECNI